jgi:hypothetical protein
MKINNCDFIDKFNFATIDNNLNDFKKISISSNYLNFEYFNLDVIDYIENVLIEESYNYLIKEILKKLYDIKNYDYIDLINLNIRIKKLLK